MAETYRADQVGSLLRPPELLQARDEHEAGKITADQLREIEDAAILKVLAMERETGISVVTDGEYRRSTWTSSLGDSIEGLIDDPEPDHSHYPNWQGPSGQLANETALTVSRERVQVIGGKVSQLKRLVGDDAAFVKAHTDRPWKMTIAGPATRCFSWFKRGITDRFYPNVEALVDEFIPIVRHEIELLVADGCPYVQLDSLRYTTWMVADRRQALIDQGIDLGKALDQQLAWDNAVLAGIRGRPGVTVGHHICRGNNRSAWAGEGGYEPVAEKLFSTMNVDRFLLEYDTERAGGFEPLRFVPADKMVVLGLVSSKLQQLESEDELLRRIDAASKYVPVERLAISPQCGFASVAPGNLLTWDEQRRKLELVAKVAQQVWG